MFVSRSTVLCVVKLAACATALLSLPGGSDAVAGCLPSECCVEAQCCAAKPFIPCTRTETCLCTWLCGPTQAKCECTCYEGGKVRPKSRTTGLALPVPLDTPAGFTISNGTLTLQAFAAELESVSGWIVRVRPGLQDLRASGSFDGTLDTVIRDVATAYGVHAHVDATAGVIAFLER
jgi:hypothetical protein